MRILIISAEVWKDSTNGGNVLSNIFNGMNSELAQIYCNPGKPENNLCKHYYQMTDSMIIHNFTSHSPVGNEFILSDTQTEEEQATNIVSPNKKMYTFFHNHRLSIFYSIKNFLWNTSNWKNNKLKTFLDNFNADIIFAPCYGNKFMLKLTRFVKEYTGKNVISYISDDSYTLKQFNLSAFYWMSRFSVRRQLRKTFPYYSLVYTMTDAQKKQCEKDFGANMKILMKSVEPSTVIPHNKINDPIQLVYAGGIYLNRWKTLKFLADSIKDINKDSIKMQLHIYTGNEITDKINSSLNDGKNTFLHDSISQKELKDVYNKSDIAIHTESFDLKNRLAVRFSFSTKIVDCLASGCAVMAICDEKQGGYCYLKDNNAAICVSNTNDIYKTLKHILCNSCVLKTYAENAKVCCERNHSKTKIQDMIKNDFELYSGVNTL